MNTIRSYPEANDENRIGVKGYVFEIDGVTGEILDKPNSMNGCLRGNP